MKNNTKGSFSSIWTSIYFTGWKTRTDSAAIFFGVSIRSSLNSKSSFFSSIGKENFSTCCTEGMVEIPFHDFPLLSLTPSLSSSILNENRMMDSDLTEACTLSPSFLLLSPGSAESWMTSISLASLASSLRHLSSFSPYRRRARVSQQQQLTNNRRTRVMVGCQPPKTEWRQNGCSLSLFKRQCSEETHCVYSSRGRWRHHHSLSCGPQSWGSTWLPPKHGATDQYIMQIVLLPPQANRENKEIPLSSYSDTPRACFCFVPY